MKKYSENVKILQICLAVLFLLVLGTSEGFGQCNWSFGNSDASCDNPDQNNDCSEVSLGNCVRNTFVPPCTGTYTLTASVSCAGGGCEHCLGCLKLYRVPALGSSEVFLTEISSESVGHGGQCAEPAVCSRSTTYNLTANTTYALYICKTSCFTHLDVGCSDRCSSSCVAKACVRIGTGVCN